jgi:hypothetical protein
MDDPADIYGMPLDFEPTPPAFGTHADGESVRVGSGSRKLL